MSEISDQNESLEVGAAMDLDLSAEDLTYLFQMAGVSKEDSESLFGVPFDSLLQLTWQEFGQTKAVTSLANGQGSFQVIKLIQELFKFKKTLGRAKDWDFDPLTVLQDFDPRDHVPSEDCVLEVGEGVSLELERIVTGYRALSALRDRDPVPGRKVFSTPAALGLQAKIYGPDNALVEGLNKTFFWGSGGTRTESRFADSRRDRVKKDLAAHMRFPSEAYAEGRVQFAFVDSIYQGTVNVMGATAVLGGQVAYPFAVTVFNFVPAEPNAPLKWMRGAPRKPYVPASVSPESVLRDLGLAQGSGVDPQRRRADLGAHLIGLTEESLSSRPDLVIGSVRDGGRSSKK